MQISPNTQPESTSKERKANRALLIAGFIVGTIGMFAFIIPQVLISHGSGDTEGAWLRGFTALSALEYRYSFLDWYCLL